MTQTVCGILLAGGQSRRMGGGDKCLRELAGKTILQHVIERAAPQVQALAINANGDPQRFEAYDLPVVADSIEGYAGPLAGVLAGMEWVAAHKPSCELMATFATDAPFAPRDLVPRLLDGLAAENADIAVASSAGRSHPVFALWPVHLRKALREAMIGEEVRKVDVFTARYRVATVEWNARGMDPFYNVNRPDDYEHARQFLQA
ncbi:MAG: molybdenum cofactor guanylyltransferase MobA [Pseudomonadota bacterium]|uniref:molybdenum cofactor guanylyltransferase MobA n=1 Tax=Fodinicurvata fenggangensis TaxID=1121830 RepID=UPI00047CE704|nr:molybdenum cofactor guanylyltransferase MobA [Fodinicurvata fenggangensis]